MVKKGFNSIRRVTWGVGDSSLLVEGLPGCTTRSAARKPSVAERMRRSTTSSRS